MTRRKDLALWNILGSETCIAAFIDFDDAISGDPMDDLSLLACFHDAVFLQQAFAGYASIRPLPEHHLRRFWLHLLRNMIVKAVIRVGAGYFAALWGMFQWRLQAPRHDLRAAPAASREDTEIVQGLGDKAKQAVRDKAKQTVKDRLLK